MFSRYYPSTSQLVNYDTLLSTAYDPTVLTGSRILESSHIPDELGHTFVRAGETCTALITLQNLRCHLPLSEVVFHRHEGIVVPYVPRHTHTYT